MSDATPALMLGTLVASALGTWIYGIAASRALIVARPGFRSLHTRPTPRGAGLVIALVWLGATVIGWADTSATAAFSATFLLGGLAATSVGFIDDTAGLRPPVKLAAQAALALLVVALTAGRAPLDLGAPLAFVVAANVLGLIWLMNAYNFMDGVDGMAASGAVFLCVGAGLAMVVGASRSGTFDPAVFRTLGLLGASCAGFLAFNLPPAKVFMGDAGSLFLGYAFGALVAVTTLSGAIGIWTWLILFAYFGGDTTTTTILRIFVARPWYGQHRSHAYQNLARERNSHRSVVVGVAAYHVVWVLPLAVSSVIVPSLAPLFAGAALAPVVVWTVIFGPLRSSS
jgi:Fuc2NAc and GlcNAc transferase